MSEVNFVKPTSFLKMLHRVAQREFNFLLKVMAFLASIWVATRCQLIRGTGNKLQVVYLQISND